MTYFLVSNHSFSFSLLGCVPPHLSTNANAYAKFHYHGVSLEYSWTFKPIKSLHLIAMMYLKGVARPGRSFCQWEPERFADFCRATQQSSSGMETRNQV